MIIKATKIFLKCQIWKGEKGNPIFPSLLNDKSSWSIVGQKCKMSVWQIKTSHIINFVEYFVTSLVCLLSQSIFVTKL